TRRSCRWFPDQRPIQALAAHGRHPSFGTHRSANAFTRGARRRNPDHIDARCGEHRVQGRRELRVQGRRELRVPVPDQEPEPVHPLIQVHQQVAGLLGNPRPRGMGGVAVRRLATSLDALGTGTVDLPERQRTLRATVDWSVGLLDDAERSLLEVAAVFVDGWTVEAAAQLAGLDGTRAPELPEA